jgi:homoserine O-acetyltransferase
MKEDLLQSSDSLRSASPLKHVQHATFQEPLALERGGRLDRVQVAYETHGQLNQAADNAVLICHALSGDSHVAGHDETDDPGWWEILVGPDKYLDTNRYFVICPNLLGGCRGTTGPNSPNPATGRPYGPDFPEITIADIVEAQRRLLDHLGIERLLGVIGGSMGGMQVLHWATAHPDRVRAAIPVAAAPRLTSQGLAFDVIGRNAITHDPNFRGGHYYDVEAGLTHGVFAPAFPVGGLAIARMIGHITYLSREAMRSKFGQDRDHPRQVQSKFEKDTSVASYLAYQGDKFVERFDANSYILISRAMDGFDLGEGRQLAANLAPARCRWLVISFTNDWLFPPDQSRQIVDALLAAGKGVSYCSVRSGCGHDAFLLEADLDAYGRLIGDFLSQTHGGCPPAAEPEEDGGGRTRQPDTSIFHGRRLDYDLLERVLREQGAGTESSVLDLGCGGGQLLLRLKRRGWRRLQGLEIDQAAVLACVRRGIDAIHADLNDGLAQFSDQQFDFVLLSRTLQTVVDVGRVVEDMLRVGRRCVVSFPNFGFEPLRRMLAEQGRAPEAGVLKHKWYNTPNIRFFTIADFQDFCREKKAAIHQRVALNTETRREVTHQANRDADLAIFVISRP